MSIDIAIGLLLGVSGLIALFIVWYCFISLNENSNNSKRKRGDGK